jgi:hypothetical protein
MEIKELSLSELLLLFPKEGWIKLVRSAINNNKWWCRYDETTEVAFERSKLDNPLQIINEAWGATPEEAIKKVLEQLKYNDIIV